MKVCCDWCQAIYTPKDPEKAKNMKVVFCTVGCRDADKLFRMFVLEKFNQLQEVRLKRLPRPRK